ncbi:DUF6488 family protein [Halioxenophilus aromaticivorans]|uniref:DUF4258 domain-containing protein n=1 Tax=Halioxenophilus aromaticivorans TaxID=1306992 RepID=A0AAV3U7N8_9ALTE
MKTATISLVLVAALFSATAGAHGKKTPPTSLKRGSAKNLVTITVQQMTFKDMGFEAGKLGRSWQSITDDNIVLASRNGSTFVYTVKNDANDKVLTVNVLNDGTVESVAFTTP